MITSKEIINHCGVTERWISARLRHLASDYVVDRYLQYDVQTLLNYVSNYKSTSKNIKQRELSNGMMKKLENYLRIKNDTRTSRT